MPAWLRVLTPLLGICATLALLLSSLPAAPGAATAAAMAAAARPGPQPALPAQVQPGGVDAAAKIDPLVLQQAQAAGQTEYFIWLAEQADLSGAAQLRTKAEKGAYVYNTLRATAERTQKALRAELDAAGVRYQPFYIANKIFVFGGTAQSALALAARPDVARITPNRQYQLPPPVVAPTAAHIPLVAPNLTFIRADQVWGAGVEGAGIVLAGNDTGLQWDHPAIRSQYRGWNGVAVDHNYSWWDATGQYPNVPGDGYGHGTHTTGTMVGDDGSTRVGVAPAAKTIHCKNMDDGGIGSDLTFTTCFQWNLAPWDLTGSNPRPDLAPHVVNNSWGRSGGGIPSFEDEVDALQAAGIAVEVSAGNEGPGCRTLRSPGDYDQVITTGSVAHGGSLPGVLSSFSSRGPSQLDPRGFFPDVMAPGENIRSSLPGDRYQAWSGTSMAGPHVSALIGLLWAANPALIGLVQETYDLIRTTATPLAGQRGSNCGGDYRAGPNNDWGHGTIDALAAVEAAAAFGGAGAISGIVTSSADGAPISGANVQIAGGGRTWELLTDSTGAYAGILAGGVYTVTVARYGYLPQVWPAVVVAPGESATLDVALTPAPYYQLSGRVTDAVTGWPLYARVAVSGGGYGGDPLWSDPVTGAYSVTLAGGMTYTVQAGAWAAGYQAAARPVPPPAGDVVLDFALVADPALCSAPGYTRGAGAEDCRAPVGGGLAVGNVRSNNSDDGLNGAAIRSEDGYTTTSAVAGGPAGNGFYTLFSPAGTKNLTVTHPGYAAASARVAVVAGGAVRQDFRLYDGAPIVEPGALSVTLQLGQTADLPLTVRNDGSQPFTFHFVERPTGFTPWAAGAASGFATGRRDAPTRRVDAAQAQARTAAPLNLPAAAAPHLLAQGEVIRSWAAAANAAPWGVAVTAAGALWISDGWGEPLMREYLPEGSATGRSHAFPWNPTRGPADLAYDVTSGKLWVLDVGSDNCLHAADPLTGFTGATICPPWPISQRGLAYDPGAGVFYAGGWNEGLIYRFAADGQILEAVNVDLAIAGLAYNPDTRHLFVMESSEGSFVHVLDAANGYASLGSFTIPGFSPYGGAGLELACDGSLWAVDQAGHTVFQVLTGERTTWCGADVPWLAVAPPTGTVPAGAAVTVNAHLDAGAAIIDQPGAYLARLTLANDTPAGGVVIPVQMAVASPPGWGGVAGVIRSLGVCDRRRDPLGLAAVTLADRHGVTVTVEADRAGVYRRWLDAAAGPYTVVAAAAGHVTNQVSGVQLVPGELVTADLDLRLDAPCFVPEPRAITSTVELGESGSALLTLRNTGAGAGTYRFVVRDAGYQVAAETVDLPAAAPAAVVPWLAVDPLTGTLAPGATGVVTLAFSAGPPIAQPGDYSARLQIGSSGPDKPGAVAVTMRVPAPPRYGKLLGSVRGLGICDAGPDPLAATVLLSGSGGYTQTVTAAADGSYVLWVDVAHGPFTVTAASAGYTAERADIVVPSDGSVQHDFTLRRLAPCIAAQPAALEMMLPAGTVGEQTLRLTNTGAVAGQFSLRERWPADAPIDAQAGVLPAGRWGRFDAPTYQVAADQAQQPTASGLNLPPPAAPHPAVQGEVLRSWAPAANRAPWGIAPTLDDHIWVGDGWGELHMDEYLLDGSVAGRRHAYAWNPIFGPADFTLNTTTGRLWVVDVYGSNCVHEVDPVVGATGVKICPPWVNSQRGLAYDGATDTWLAGGWNDGLIHRFNAAGELLDSHNVGLAVAGLAYNPDTAHLFVIENSAASLLHVLDAANDYASVRTISIPGFAAFGGAGLELDCAGNLWLVDQASDRVLAVASGETTTRCAAPIGWLEAAPAAGVLAVGETATVTVRYNAAGLPGGRYSAILGLFQDAPGAESTPITITLNVRVLPTPMVTRAPIATPTPGGTPVPTATPTTTPVATGSVTPAATPTPTPTEAVIGADSVQLYLPFVPLEGATD